MTRGSLGGSALVPATPVQEGQQFPSRHRRFVRGNYSRRFRFLTFVFGAKLNLSNKADERTEIETPDPEEPGTSATFLRLKRLRALNFRSRSDGHRPFWGS